MFTMSFLEKRRVFPLPQYCGGDSGTPAAAEMDLESNASPAEEVVQKLKRRSIKLRVHSQILRIKAEDSHLGEDIGEGNLSLKEKFGITQLMAFSRPILPASPLGGRTSY